MNVDGPYGHLLKGFVRQKNTSLDCETKKVLTSGGTLVLDNEVTFPVSIP